MAKRNNVVTMVNTETREEVYIENETPVTESKILPDYKAIGENLYNLIANHTNTLRDTLVEIFSMIGKDADGYKAIAESFASGYANPDTKKNMKSAINAIFTAYVVDSEKLLNGTKEGDKTYSGLLDTSTQWPQWQKLARVIKGKSQKGRPAKTGLTDSERDNIVDKIDDFASQKDAEVFINVASEKLNGEARMHLINHLINAMVNDDDAEEIYRTWALSARKEVNDLLNRVNEAKQKAETMANSIKNSVHIAETE